MRHRLLPLSPTELKPVSNGVGAGPLKLLLPHGTRHMAQRQERYSIPKIPLAGCGLGALHKRLEPVTRQAREELGMLSMPIQTVLCGLHHLVQQDCRGQRRMHGLWRCRAKHRLAIISGDELSGRRRIKHHVVNAQIGEQLECPQWIGAL